MVKALRVILLIWICMSHCVPVLFGTPPEPAVQQMQQLNEQIQHLNVVPEKSLKQRFQLVQLYHRTGAYQKALKLLLDIPQKAYNSCKGEYFLARAQNAKYQFQLALSKQFFELALIDFSLRQEQCKLLETHIELMEYYRKIDAMELAFKEADIIKEFLHKNTSCDPILSIRYLNRLASIQNNDYHHESIATSYRCIDSCKKYNEPYYLAVSYNEIGFSYHHILNLDSANHYYWLAENSFREQGYFSDALHAKMNRVRMYAHKRIHLPEIIPGLLEIEEEAKLRLPNYDYLECYRCVWVEAYIQKKWELAFRYIKLHYEIELDRASKNIRLSIEKIKLQEKESKTRLQNFVLNTQLDKQNTEIKQNRLIILLGIIALLVFSIITFFLFRILRQRNALTEDLRLRNQQKDQLIQEVHHRVKNNLSFVSSLLEMQINSLPEEAKTEELKNAGLRIESMSLVHQMLYNQDDISKVDLSLYISELIPNLKDALGHHSDILFLISCDSVPVESRTATAFGLIITEFITNSYKHAFKGISDPKIELFLKKSGKKIELVLRDNGVGMNPNESQTRKGFGMRIIDIFSRQINAKINFSYTDGTQLTLNMEYES